MKKALFGLVMFAMAAMASASGFTGAAGGLVAAGQASVYSGSINGTVKSVGHGEAVSATFISGAGSSKQMTRGTTVGSASATGIVNSQGVTANTTTFQKTNFVSKGSISGSGAQAIDGGSNILNGTQGFGSVENDAKATGTFSKGTIGGAVAIGGIVGFARF